MTKLSHKLFVFGVIVVLAVLSHWFYFSYSAVPDSDSFYHIRHAWLYRTQSLFESEFPWAQYSVMKTYGADIWYGFHMLLTPLTFFSDLLIGIKVGGALTTIITLCLVYWALMRLRVRWPLLWLFFFFFASADLLYRITMLRPHPLSLGLALALFACLAHRSEKQSSHTYLWLIFGVSMLFSWIHLALSWVPIAIAGAFVVARLLQRAAVDWRGTLAVIAGLVPGWLLRPNPFGAAKLAYIQVVQLMIEKQRDIPLRFGTELRPFGWDRFFDQLIPITTLFIIAVVAVAWLSLKKERFHTMIWACMMLSGGFLYLLSGAHRANDFFVSFAAIFLALVFTHAWQRPLLPRAGKNVVSIVAIGLLVYMPVHAIYRVDTYLGHVFFMSRFKDVGTWLKENTPQGTIVFNPHWDRFAQLFFWNQHNYFINGMDPIFEYAYDPALYWKTHFLAIDQGTAFTCGKIRCVAGETEDTPTVLKRDFNASYIVIEQRRSPKLHKYLESAREFQKVFEAPEETVYKIL